jgi:hypothetical protein
VLPKFRDPASLPLLGIEIRVVLRVVVPPAHA